MALANMFAAIGHGSAVSEESIVISRRLAPLLVTGALLLSLLPPAPAGAAVPAIDESAAHTATSAQEVRTVWASDLGVGRPRAVTFAPDRNELLVAASGADGTEVVRLGFDEDVLGRFMLPPVDHVSTLAYDVLRGVLTVVDDTDRLEVAGSDLGVDRPGVARVDVSAVGLGDPLAAGFDPVSGDWVVVDGTNNTVVRSSSSGKSSRRSLGAGMGRLRGPAALNGTDGLLYMLTQNERSLLAVDEIGAVQETIDVSAIDFANPVAMTFAPSSDTTDEPAKLNLFVADAGDAKSLGGVVEVSLTAAVPLALEPVVETATLVRETDTSLWVPGSPDPSGVVYLPGDDVLTVVDSEVDETTGAGYHDVNMWMTNRAGLVVRTGTTWTSSVGGYPAYSKEPTGLGYDPATGPATDRLFISDDSASGVHVVQRGPDGLFGTADDLVGFVDTASGDVEDPELVGGILYQLDGVSSEIYRIDPVDGIFGNLDDSMTSFDIGYLGPADWEGLASDPTRGTLYVGARATDQIFEITTGGDLVRTINVDVAGLRYISGLATALNSGGALSFFIVDRAVDNGADSNENDGKLFEVQVGDPVPPSNLPPVVNAGADFVTTAGTNGALQGLVIDDGLPTGATVTQLWGVDPSSPLTDVTFADPTVPSTDATFGTAGTYVLLLTADDTELTGSDTVTVTVDPAGTVTRSYVISAGNEDAEQRLPNRGGDLDSGDLDLGLDGSTPNAVGLRFVGMDVPQGATILSASLQFRADETGSSTSVLSIAAQAAGDAAPFTTDSGDISNRPLGTQQVSWMVPAWSKGDRGLAQVTPDLNAVIQEVVNRGDWAANSALAFVITGSGLRAADTIEGGYATRLDIKYTTVLPNVVPVVDAGADQTITLPAGVVLAGSATDSDGPDPLTILWTGSGPGTVSFLDDADVGTTASFSTDGVYVLTLSADDGELSSSDEVTVTVGVPGTAQLLYVSFTSTTSVPGIASSVRDEDIVVYDTGAGTWALYFDASDVGIGSSDLDAFHVRADGSVLMSFSSAVSIPGLTGGPDGTTIDDSDVILFSPINTGEDTAGSFSFFLDGSDMDLTANGEDIDGLYEFSDGTLGISTTGSIRVGALASGGDEDVHLFTPATTGSVTTGAWTTVHFDGSDIGLTSSGDDLSAISFDFNGDLLYSTVGTNSTPGSDDEDIDRFAGSYGPTTSGTATLELDLSSLGIDPSADVDAVHIGTG
jgi:hypothetical protein